MLLSLMRSTLHHGQGVGGVAVELVGLPQVPRPRMGVLDLHGKVGGEPAPHHVAEPLPLVPAVCHLAVHLDHVPAVQV